MKTHERMRGRCALLAIAALTTATGCGNTVSELLQPLSAMQGVSSVGQGDAAINRTGEQKTQTTDTNATLGCTPRPDRTPDAADREQPAGAHPAGRPPRMLQTNKDQQKGAGVEPRSGGGPTAHCAPRGPGQTESLRPGPHPLTPARTTNATEAEKGGE